MEAKNTEENLKSKQQGLKVGSRVKLLQSGYLTMHEGEIVRENPSGSWVVRMDDGKTIEVPKRKVITANAAVSSNAVVQYALAWKAERAASMRYIGRCLCAKGKIADGFDWFRKACE